MQHNQSKLLPIFDAQWIWDESHRLSDHYYLEVRRNFSIPAKRLAKARQINASTLHITADAYYQAWLNGTILGHGPAKSPEGKRAVDMYDISRLLVKGDNLLEVLVLSVGTSTMNYCLGKAGLLFAICLPGMVIPSDCRSVVRWDPRRRRKTIRRWIMPDIEDVAADARSPLWQPATIVPKNCELISRPVPLPSRKPFVAGRVVAHHTVKLPEFICSFNTKPYLVEPEQIRRCNSFSTPAWLVTDLVSPRQQTITWLTAPGSVTWYFQGRSIGSASGWSREEQGNPAQILRLKRGSNRLIGIHENDHFSQIHLAAFAQYPLRATNPFGPGGFQIIRIPKDTPEQNSKQLPKDIDDRISSSAMVTMDPNDTRANANFHDLVLNAKATQERRIPCDNINHGWRLPPVRNGNAARLILDFGAVQNGWLSFECFGSRGSRLIFSLVEAIDFGPPLTINWPGACNNSLSYRLRNGWQTFESFFAYGGRYLIIHHTGDVSVELASLKLLSANCGHLPQGDFLSDNTTLNDIWSLCEQTLVSATDDTLTDCPTYEAVNWNFDNRLASMADLVTMRNLPLLRNSIEQFIHDPTYSGLVRSHYPSAWDNRIPAFSFHWILFCKDFYKHTGDSDFLEAVLPQITRGLGEAIGMISTNDLLLWPMEEAPWHIIDWHQGRDDSGQPFVSAEQALFIGALEAGAELTRSLQKQSLWRVIASRLRRAIHREFWVQERDAYADSIHVDGKLSPVSSQVSNAALALYGVGTSTWRKRLLRRLQESSCNLLPYGSPMGLFYILEYLDANKECHAIFDVILRKWGQMIKAGDRTAWEHFPEFENKRFPTRSRCHPFSTYILKYFRKYLLGIDPVGIGTEKVRFCPRPPHFVNRVQGIFPTEQGPIRICWRRVGRRIRSNIETPKGIEKIL